MRSFLGENDMMAYLAMMAIRLIELHRVLIQAHGRKIFSKETRHVAFQEARITGRRSYE